MRGIFFFELVARYLFWLNFYGVNFGLFLLFFCCGFEFDDKFSFFEVYIECGIVLLFIVVIVVVVFVLRVSFFRYRLFR